MQHQCFFEGDQAPKTRCGCNTGGYPILNGGHVMLCHLHNRYNIYLLYEDTWCTYTFTIICISICLYIYIHTILYWTVKCMDGWMDDGLVWSAKPWEKVPLWFVDGMLMGCQLLSEYQGNEPNGNCKSNDPSYMGHHLTDLDCDKTMQLIPPSILNQRLWFFQDHPCQIKLPAIL